MDNPGAVQSVKLAWVNLPTAVTLLRLAGIPFVLLGLSLRSPLGERLALWAFLLAAATDLLVGRELVIAGWRANQSQIRGANLWGKAKTVTQILAIALLILGWPGGIPCFWVAVVLTLISGLTYLHNDGVAKSSPSR